MRARTEYEVYGLIGWLRDEFPADRSTAEVAARFGWRRRAALYRLRVGARSGLIHATGTGRGRRWFARPVLPAPSENWVAERAVGAVESSA